MVESKIVKPYNGRQTFTLSKNSDATNWTMVSYSAVKQGSTAFIRITATCGAGQNADLIPLVNLPTELHPFVEQQLRAHHSSGGFGTDCNITITTSGIFYVQLPEVPQGTVAFRMFIVYPTAN